MDTNQTTRKETKLEKWLTIIILFIVGCFMIIGLINTYNYNQTIKKNKYVTVAKVVKFEYIARGGSRTYYNYYYNQKIYYGFKHTGSSNENCIDKYYKLELSTKNPEYSDIFLDQEVTDSTEIINAGFKYK